jgi:serine protease Do
MSKKAIFLFIILLVIIGLLGGYCFNLNKEIVALTELQEEANRQISDLQGGINSLDIKMTDFNEQTGSRITGLEDKIGALSTSIEDLPLPIDVTGLYQKVSQGVVEVVAKAEAGKESNGTGFIYNEWSVVTASHVVEEANKADVILHDGTIIAADRISYCPYSDIAVLRLEQAVAVEAMTLGDSNALDIGEPVMVMGSPFELSGTVTSGIVSQKNRFVDIEYNDGENRAVANLIQCDAAVNFGNSGGPLINARDEVIGLVIARVDPGEGDGVYYAVSANKLRRVAGALIDYGSFAYPWLGVGLADLTPEEARARQLDTINGARVATVLSGPAALVGIRVNDIIVAIDGIPVNEKADLASYLGEYKSPQETAALTIIRNGERLELSVPLEKRRD